MRYELLVESGQLRTIVNRYAQICRVIAATSELEGICKEYFEVSNIDKMLKADISQQGKKVVCRRRADGLPSYLAYEFRRNLMTA